MEFAKVLITLLNPLFASFRLCSSMFFTFLYRVFARLEITSGCTYHSESLYISPGLLQPYHLQMIVNVGYDRRPNFSSQSPLFLKFSLFLSVALCTLSFTLCTPQFPLFLFSVPCRLPRPRSTCMPTYHASLFSTLNFNAPLTNEWARARHQPSFAKRRHMRIDAACIKADVGLAIVRAVLNTPPFPPKLAYTSTSRAYFLHRPPSSPRTTHPARAHLLADSAPALSRYLALLQHKKKTPKTQSKSYSATDSGRESPLHFPIVCTYLHTFIPNYAAALQQVGPTASFSLAVCTHTTYHFTLSTYHHHTIQYVRRAIRGAYCTMSALPLLALIALPSTPARRPPSPRVAGRRMDFAPVDCPHGTHETALRFGAHAPATNVSRPGDTQLLIAPHHSVRTSAWYTFTCLSRFSNTSARICATLQSCPVFF